MWLKILPKQDYMLTLSGSIFTHSWEETSLPGENCHWRPLVLVNHRDLDFINEAIELAKHHPILLLGTHIPCRRNHFSKFLLSTQHVFPQLWEHSNLYFLQSDSWMSWMKPPPRETRHSRQKCFAVSYWLCSRREVLRGITCGLV